MNAVTAPCAPSPPHLLQLSRPIRAARCARAESRALTASQVQAQPNGYATMERDHVEANVRGRQRGGIRLSLELPHAWSLAER